MKSDNSLYDVQSSGILKCDTPVTDEWRIGTEFSGGSHGLIGAFFCNLSRGNEGTPEIYTNQVDNKNFKFQ